MEKIKCEEIGKLCGGKWDKLHDISRRVYGIDGLSPTVHTAGGGQQELKIAEPNYHIRKLTERECFRLMGVKGEDFDKIAKNQSMSSLYHLAGDSIVTACLMAIFGLLLEVDYKQKITELTEGLKEK